jgi:molybdopterin-dependent oxidoreductase-like protein protein
MHPAHTGDVGLTVRPRERPRFWPTFRSALHEPAVAARIGRVLGICVLVCFGTGLLSHYQYHPWSWLPEPATPAWGYRLSQGVHVFTGIACIPLVLVKLWTVYPRLFAWPPVRSVLHALERLSVAVLVATMLLELITGLLNILNWYPWPWDFVYVHYALAWVVAGSVTLHVAIKLDVIRIGVATPISRSAGAQVEGSPDPGRERPTSGISRRGLLIAAAGGVGVVTLTTVGQAANPLEPFAVLAPRRPDEAPLGVPINRTAAQAEVVSLARAGSYRLMVEGPTSFDLDLAALAALPAVERVIPLACVEGWSLSARWRGVRLIDLVLRAGGDVHSAVRVVSLETVGAFGSSLVRGPQLGEAILATHLNGSRLTLDHGYPVRLIAPNRAGVLNTKWLTRVTVL